MPDVDVPEEVRGILRELAAAEADNLPRLSIDVATRDGYAFLELHGDIHLDDPDRVFEALRRVKEAMRDHAPLIGIDLSACRFICSSAIAVLTAFLRSFGESEIKPCLINPQDRIAALLDMVGISSMFSFVSSQTAAVARIEGRAPSQRIITHRHVRDHE